MILANFRRTRSPFIRTLSYSMPPRRKASVLADDDERPSKKAKNDDTELEPKAKKPRARKVKAAPEPLVDARTAERKAYPWKLGAHVSAAGGVENSITNAIKIGATAFALFLKSQRKWVSPPLTEDSITAFKQQREQYGFDAKHILPHGSYLINLGNPDAEKRKKSFDCFVDDLQRCEQLGLELYNFHPGSTVGEATVQHCITLIAQSINAAHKATSSVITVLENMAGAGNIIGSNFAHLGEIIQQVEDKSRVGVCLDTCHMFAAGYDIRTKEGWDQMLQTFDEQVGLSYLKGMHLNDSKTELSSKKDRHDNIGLGHVGLHAFGHIVRDVRVQDIPLVLETPTGENEEIWARELDVLHTLSTSILNDNVPPAVDTTDRLLDNIRVLVKEKKPAKSAVKKKGTSNGKGKGKNKKEMVSDDDRDDGNDDDGEHSHE